MGWSVGYDEHWKRDIGYGVPAWCDHPDCTKEIDRGLAYVCCGQEPYGGKGCGLYFCYAHQTGYGKCEKCAKRRVPFKPKADHPMWIVHKLTDPSWAEWRATEEVTRSSTRGWRRAREGEVVDVRRVGGLVGGHGRTVVDALVGSRASGVQLKQVL